MDVFTQQIHNDPWDIVSKADLQAAANVVVSAIDGIGAKQKNVF